jgi:hypothetical protein
MACWKASNVFVAVVVLVVGAGGAAAAETRRVAFFGFFLINTSLQPTQPAEEKRLEMLDTVLRDQLAGAGRFSFVAIPPEVQKQAVAGSGIPNCNGCERDLAEKTGAVHGGRADRQNRICPQRRHSRQHRRIVASWSQLHDPALRLGAALT